MCFTDPFDPETIYDSDRGIVVVRLIERGDDGIEVQLEVTTPIVTASATLTTETAAALGEALIDHAERADMPRLRPS